MTGRTIGMDIIGRATALALGTALLAGCGGQNSASSNIVEMRDMDVVDGTANDAMTDLDAVSADGLGGGTPVLNSAASTAVASNASE